MGSTGNYRRLSPNEPVVPAKDWVVDLLAETPAAAKASWGRTAGLTMTAVITVAADGTGASCAVTVLELTGTTGGYRFTATGVAIAAAFAALLDGANVYLRILSGTTLLATIELDYFKTARTQ